MTTCEPLTLCAVAYSVEKEVLALLEVARIRLGNSQHAARSAISDAISVLTSALDRDAQWHFGPRSADTLSSRQVQRIREYIDQHMDQPVGVADLGRVLGSSSAHFSRRFKRTVGLTPHAYLMQQRIAFASRLLVQTDLPMCDIALKCGFCDQAHFARRFRNLTGIKPTAWRRTMGEAENARAVA